jgi:GH18 family chitinase
MVRKSLKPEMISENFCFYFKKKDLHGGWDNTTGHNAPLYAHEFDKDKTLNVVSDYIFGQYNDWLR